MLSEDLPPLLFVFPVMYMFMYTCLCTHKFMYAFALACMHACMHVHMYDGLQGGNDAKALTICRPGPSKAKLKRRAYYHMFGLNKTKRSARQNRLRVARDKCRIRQLRLLSPGLRVASRSPTFGCDQNAATQPLNRIKKVESHMRFKIFQKYAQARDSDHFRCLWRRSTELGEASGSAASFVEA